MQGGSADHDRDTDEPDRDTTVVAEPRSEAMAAAIERLRLQGAVFLRAEYREPWAYESLAGPVTANLLRPGTDRVILFHVVASGRCWVTVEDGPRHWASAG